MICRSNGSESQGCSHLLAHTVPSNSSSRAHSVCQPELVTSPNTIPGLALPPFSTISDLSDPPAIQGTAAGRSRMDHGSASSFNAKRSFRFTRKEVKQMEEKLKPRTTSRPDRVLMRELALKFSESRGRAGTTTPVTPKQVRCSSSHRFFIFRQRSQISQQLGFNPICAGELVLPACRSSTGFATAATTRATRRQLPRKRRRRRRGSKPASSEGS